jgi:large subunit ribosomal protein L24
VEKEAGIAVSNVAIFNPKTQKADKIAIRVEADGKKTRLYKSDQSAIG